MTELNDGLHSCLNCGAPTQGKYNYRGVVVCSACFGLVRMCEERMEKQLGQLKVVYTESLRQALASGRLQPSKLPKPPKMPDLDKLRKILGPLAEIKKDG